MRSTIFGAVLAVGAMFTAGGKADAQIFYPYYGPTYSYNYGVNPYTGAGYSTYNYGVPGVYGYNTSTYGNPWGGYGQTYGVTNPFGNSYYQTTYNNPWTGRGVTANYTVFPNGMYRGYYRRW